MSDITSGGIAGARGLERVREILEAVEEAGFAEGASDGKPTGYWCIDMGECNAPVLIAEAIATLDKHLRGDP